MLSPGERYQIQNRLERAVAGRERGARGFWAAAYAEDVTTLLKLLEDRSNALSAGRASPGEAPAPSGILA